MDEKKILDRIKESSRDIEIPEKLKPENLDEILGKKSRQNINLNAEQNASQDTEQNLEKNSKMDTEQEADLKQNQEMGSLLNEENAESGAAQKSESERIQYLEDCTHKKLRRSQFLKWGSAAAAVCVLFLGAITLGRGGLEGNETASVTKSDTSSAHTSSADMDTSEKNSDGKTADVEEGVVDVEEVLSSAESYENIYDMLEKYYETVETRLGYDTGASSDTAVESTGTTEAIAEDVSAAESTSTGGLDSFSTTNIQELGVEEGDIVKTDGTYIYIAKGEESIQIFEADGSDVKLIGVIAVDSGEAGSEEVIEDMYLSGDKLAVIITYMNSRVEEVAKDVSQLVYRTETRTEVFDITDRSDPKSLGETSMEGYYQDSRLVDGYLYLYTNCFKSVDVRVTGKQKLEDYIPMVNDEVLKADEIYIPDQVENSNYMVLASMNLDKPEEIVDKKAILSTPYEIYVSQNNIYTTEGNWMSDSGSTTITKISFNKGKIKPQAAGIVLGYLNDNFAMSEYDGNFRVVTTSYSGGESKNNLYILDENMKIRSSIKDLASGETIQSSRFMGAIGYFVTYKNMDPLFSVDLSDPDNPEILGALKITGFSEYLHFYSENLLFGLGYETDPDTGESQGIKLSMYDISDPGNVQEVKKTVLDLDAAVPLSEYNALLIDSEKNIIGFAGTKWEEDSSWTNRYYQVFSYDPEQGFVQKMNEELEDYTDPWLTRGIYIGDTLYLSEGASNKLKIFDMINGYTKVGDMDY